MSPTSNRVRVPRSVEDTVWSQMASGRLMPLTGTTPADVDLTEIAQHLAKICRFAGATNGIHYSIAQHSLIVAEQLPPEWRAYGLLHDAHVALLGDIPAPARRVLVALGAGDALRRLETSLSAAIHVAAGLSWPRPKDIRRAIDRADRVTLATERRDILAPSDWPTNDADPPLPRPIRALAWPDALDRYLDALETYIPTVADTLRLQGSL